VLPGRSWRSMYNGKVRPPDRGGFRLYYRDSGWDWIAAERAARRPAT
jgi:ribosomal protein L15E